MQIEKKTKIIPTIEAVISYFVYFVVACGCNYGIIWVLSKYNFNQAAVYGLAVAGLAIGLIMGFKAPSRIHWRA